MDFHAHTFLPAGLAAITQLKRWNDTARSLFRYRTRILFVAVLAALMMPGFNAIASVGIALWAIIASFARLRNRRIDRPHASEHTVANLLPLSALCVVVALVVLIPLWLHKGMPVFNQDWGAFPVFQEQLASWARYTLSGWLPDGLGHPNAFPFNYPAQLLAWAFGTVLGPAAGIRAFLVLELTAAGIFSTALLKRLGITSRSAIIVGAVLYETSPVVLNKLGAGHWAYLVAYAVMPGAIFFADRLAEEPNWSDAASLCFLTIVAGSQGQFLIFIAFFVFVLAVFKARIGSAAAMIASIAAAYIAHLPGFYPLLAHVSVSYLSVEKALVFWEQFQSVAPTDAIQLVGYIAGYSGNVYQGIRSVIPFAIGAMVAVAIIMPRTSRPRLFSALTLLSGFALLMEMGLKGPLSGVLTAAFANSTSFSFFRELYNFAVFPALLAASGLAFVVQRFQKIGAVFGAALVVATTLFTTQFATVLEYWAPSAAAIAAVKEIAAEPGEGRVLWLPAPAPIGTETHSGLEPMTVPIGRHASLQGTLVTPFTGWIQANAMRGHLSAAALSAAGVQWVAFRPTVHSAATSVETSLRRAIGAALPPAPGVSLEQLRHIGRTVVDDKDIVLVRLSRSSPRLRFANHTSLFRGWDTRRAVASAGKGDAVIMVDPARPEVRATQGVNPTTGAAPSAYWFWLNTHLDDAPAFGRFILKGTLCTQAENRVLLNETWSFRSPGCYRGRIVATDPGISFPLPSRRQGTGRITLVHGDWLTGRYSGIYHASSTALMLFAEQYDPRWSCIVDGHALFRPSLANAYEMAFSLPAGSHRFEIVYGPAIVMARLFAIAALVICCTAGVLIFSGFRRLM